jgi:hypothetical protein
MVNIKGDHLLKAWPSLGHGQLATGMVLQGHNRTGAGQGEVINWIERKGVLAKSGGESEKWVVVFT